MGEPRSPAHRARALVLLTVTVVVLGSLAAGLLGGAAFLTARFLNRALGS